MLMVLSLYYSYYWYYFYGPSSVAIPEGGTKRETLRKCRTLKVIVFGLVAEALTEQNGVVSLD